MNPPNVFNIDWVVQYSIAILVMYISIIYKIKLTYWKYEERIFIDKDVIRVYDVCVSF